MVRSFLNLFGVNNLLPEIWIRFISYPILLAFTWIIPETFIMSQFGATSGPKFHDIDKTVALLQQAIRIKPEYVQANHILGLTYLSAGNRKAALEKYQTLLAIDSDLAEELLDYI